jgi:parallel beta-helix repeat protein
MLGDSIVRAPSSITQFLFFVVVALASAHSAFAQGSLTPPGPPGSTMKTLDQIDAKLEKRIPISAAPFTITTSGTYYLAQNLVAESGDAIRVNAAGVSVDLNGFTISTNAPGTGSGVVANADSCTISNGRTTDFAIGISGSSVSTTVVGVSCKSCTAGGILVGNGALVRRCRVSNNGGQYGISANDGSAIEECTVTTSSVLRGIKAGAGCRLTNCVVLSNTTQEAALEAGLGSTITDCTVNTNVSLLSTSAGIHGLGANIVTGCIARGTLTLVGFPTNDTGIGIWAGADSSVQGCTATGNSGDGIRIESRSSVTDCVASGNGSATFGGGIVAGSGANGVRIAIKNCVATANHAYGIQIVGGCVVQDCLASDNGHGGSAAGIGRVGGSRNRIEGNQTRDNKGRGILADVTDAVIHNSAGQNDINYDPNTGSFFGALQVPNNATNPFANVEVN